MGKFSFDPSSVEPLGRAGSGDYSLLAVRIRNGSACQEERNLAADIIEGKHKRPANRPASYDKFERDMEIYYFVEGMMQVQGYPKDAAVKAAEKEFKMTKSTIYEAVARISAALDAAYSGN